MQLFEEDRRSQIREVDCQVYWSNYSIINIIMRAVTIQIPDSVASRSWDLRALWSFIVFIIIQIFIILTILTILHIIMIIWSVFMMAHAGTILFAPLLSLLLRILIHSHDTWCTCSSCACISSFQHLYAAHSFSHQLSISSAVFIGNLCMLHLPLDLLWSFSPFKYNYNQ